MPDTVSGILKRSRDGSGVLREIARSLRPGPNEVTVPPTLARRFALVEGAFVTGPVQRGKRGPELAAVESVGGLKPEDFAARTPYADLVAIDPHDRFHLADFGAPDMRVLDLVAPIGKGARSLIVSPPKAGKTTILEHIANAIYAEDPKVRVIVLLIDERPEEVTHFRRSVKAEVIASSNDQSVAEHVELSEMMLAHIRTELECGRDIVVLIDSLTRMGRAFNLRGSGTGRTMSGGVEAGALEIPRRFFGLARNIENGGSVTIVGTILVDTGSRMDQLIFEEFKGTGNSELVLDRALSEQRIFPAVNVNASGTRKEELLYGPDDVRRIHKIRRMLSGMKPDEAMTTLQRLFEKYPTNREFLEGIPLEK